ncbi:MAG: VOC family protein [Synechococcales bacterium]|nr:VOC family protein [Synechococcales bacterium]
MPLTSSFPAVADSLAKWAIAHYKVLDFQLFFPTTRQETTSMAVTQGLHHFGLTVPDLAATRSFFTDTLGFNQIGEVPDYPAVFLSDGSVMLTLWQATNPDQATAFDRKNNIGLHHFALKVNSLDTLHSAHQTLMNTAGVAIEFAPQPVGGGPSHHMMFTIPGGIRMELFAPGA